MLQIVDSEFCGKVGGYALLILEGKCSGSYLKLKSVREKTTEKCPWMSRCNRDPADPIIDGEVAEAPEVRGSN